MITQGRTIGRSWSVPLRPLRFPFVFPVQGQPVRGRPADPTAIELALRHAPRCPICTHGARLWPIYNLDAWRCRWGHLIYGEDLAA